MDNDVKQFLREAVADHAHRIWTKWLSYMFSKGIFNDNGSWTLPKDFVDRWTAQMTRKYKELSEKEKDSDRRVADQYLTIFWLFQNKKVKEKETK